MALDFLSIQISFVASKFAFSLSGRVLTDYCSRYFRNIAATEQLVKSDRQLWMGQTNGLEHCNRRTCSNNWINK